MGRHRSSQPAQIGRPSSSGHGRPAGPPPRRTALWVAVAVLAVVATASTAVAVLAGGSDQTPGAGGPSCERSLRVVTSSSFAPVLDRLEPVLDRDRDCIALDTVVVDGRAAADRVAEREADVWIPDDASWAAVARPGLLAEEGRAGSGTVLASSPIYMVTDGPTAAKIKTAGGSWLGLADLLTGSSGVRLAVRDPNTSGDGMVAAGSLGEAVWLDRGMDASSAALSTALRVTRTVPGEGGSALPERGGEVGLVPEYALLSAPERMDGRSVLAGSDHTALLRFAWLPTAAAVDTPERAAALQRLLSALKGAGAAAAIAAARLRRPDGGLPAEAPKGELPALAGKPLEVLRPHHVDHVFAAWYVQDRRSSILLVVDVSGSMLDPAPGSQTPLIDLVRQGCLAVGRLLPDESSLGLWIFGSRLQPPHDHRVLLPTEPLGPAQRAALGSAVRKMTALTTGTGLYDTILAAYAAATESHREGMGNQVVVFTDGRNEDDPGSITAEQLAGRLKATADPQRRVELTVVAYGSRPEVKVLEDVLEPVGGYVSKVQTPQEVSAAFIHAAASGVHG